MKLHSDILTTGDVYDAATLARSHGHEILVEDTIKQGSRSRHHGITFHCYSWNGRFRNGGNYGADQNYRAASWTAWGWLIAALFVVDPNAIIGQYKDPADFRRQCTHMMPHRRRYGDNIEFLDWLEDRIDRAVLYPLPTSNEPTGVSS